MKSWLLVFLVSIVVVSPAFGDVAVIPTDEGQDNLLSAYRFATTKGLDSWVRYGAVDSAFANLYGEVPILWSAEGATRGSFIYPAEVSGDFDFSSASIRPEELGNGYSISLLSGTRFAVYRSAVTDFFGQSATWEFSYFYDLLDNYIDFAGYTVFDETTFADIPSSVKIIIIPAFEIGDSATEYFDRVAEEFPEFGEALAGFLSSGKTIYAEGNGCYLLEKFGLLAPGSVDLSDPVDGGGERMIAGVEAVDPSVPMGFPLKGSGIYTVFGPTLSARLPAVVRFTSTLDAADSGKTAIALLEGEDAFGGRIILSAGMPTAGIVLAPGEYQWQVVANALLYPFCYRVNSSRSVYTGVDIDSVDVANFALPVDDCDTFTITVRIRNLWDIPVSDITIEENFKSYFDFVDAEGAGYSVSGNRITFSIPSIPAHSELVIRYRLATPPEGDERRENINSYLDYYEYMHPSNSTLEYTDPVNLLAYSFYRNSLWTLMLFEANIVADTDLNWKNILGEYFQPFKIFVIMENKERTSAVRTRYEQYIPLDVPVLWVDPMSIPIIRTPGGEFVDLLRGSADRNLNGVLDPGELEYDMDADGDPDAWVDFSTFYPYPDTIELDTIYWFNPWKGGYEDIDGDGLIARDDDGDGVFEVEDPDDRIRAYRCVWNIDEVPGYQFYDPYASWEIWIDPPPLVDMAIGAPDTLGYDGPDTGGFYYPGWTNWMAKDDGDNIIFRRLVYQTIDSYEGFAFVDSDYVLRPGDTDYGWVPYPRREYICVLNLGGEEPTMTSPTPDSSKYANIYYKTIWGKEKITPIRTTYTYYAPLPNPLQFEYISTSYKIEDPGTGRELRKLPGSETANLQFKITASTEYSYYWIALAGQDWGTYRYDADGNWVQVSAEKDTLGDGVFGYIILNIPKGLGGYEIDLPRDAEGEFDISAICPDFVPFVFDDPEIGTEVEVWEFPFYYSIYIPQVLIPPALDDDNHDGVDDWLDDKGDRFESETGYLHDFFPPMTGEEAEAVYGVGWYEGEDGERGDDDVEKLGSTSFTVNAIFRGHGREGILKINDGAWLVNEEIFGGSPWVQFSHAQSAEAIANNIALTRKVTPTMVSLQRDTLLLKYRIYDWNEPHTFDEQFDPYVASYGYGDVTISTHTGGKEALSLLTPDIVTRARIDPTIDEVTVTAIPGAAGNDTLLARGYPKTETGAFLFTLVEIDNGTDNHLVDVRVRPDLSGLGATEEFLWYACYPRPLVPAHYNPETGEWEAGDTPGSFIAGWRFNPSANEVWTKIGDPDGTASIPEILASRRGYFVFVFKIDPSLPVGVYEIPFELTAGEMYYTDEVPTPVSYEIPPAKFAIVRKNRSGITTTPAYFVIGDAELSELETQLEDYVTLPDATSCVRYSISEPRLEEFDTYSPLPASVLPGNILSTSLPYSSAFPPAPTLTSFWVSAFVETEAPYGTDNLLIDNGAHIRFTDYFGIARERSTSAIRVVARGADVKVDKLVSEVNGEPVGRDGYYQLAEGENCMTVLLLMQNVGNDIAASPSLYVQLLDDEVTFDSSAVYPARYVPEERRVYWDAIPDIAPGERRTIPVYLSINKSEGILHILSTFSAEYGLYRAASNDTIAYSLDLAVSDDDISIYPEELTAGQNGIVSAVVHHSGLVNAKNVPVRIYLGDPEVESNLLGEEIIPNLDVRDSVATVSVEFTVPEVSSVLEFYVLVDPTDLFLEENEKNNTAYAVLSIAGREPIVEVVNYPNPFDGYTEFTYTITCPVDEVTIKVYTSRGRLVKKFENAPASVGYNRLPWDGRDDAGDQIANGTYTYTITAKGEGVNYTVKEKLVRMR